MPESVLAAIIDIPPNLGYAAVFALITIETMGIPVPGETALIHIESELAPKDWWYPYGGGGAPPHG